VTALVRCPKCGQMEGIRLYHASEGMTDCQCAACGRVVCTCPDGDHDECWNAAGAHAQALRDRVAALEAAIAEARELIDSMRVWAGMQAGSLLRHLRAIYEVLRAGRGGR